MMEISNNTYYSKSDAEFEDFCIAPYATIEKSSRGDAYYVQGHYSDEYKGAVSKGVSFVIMDEDSVVYKRQCVCKRVPLMMDGVGLRRDTLVQLDVENLKPWFGKKYR